MTGSERVFLIRTTKYESGTKALWWGPDECGYTTDLDAAGLYTAEDVARILTRSPWSTRYLAATVRGLRVAGQVSVEADALDHPGALPDNAGRHPAPVGVRDLMLVRP